MLPAFNYTKELEQHFGYINGEFLETKHRFRSAASISCKGFSVFFSVMSSWIEITLH